MSSIRGEQTGLDQFPIIYEGLPELAYQFLLPDDLGAAVHVSRGAGAAYELIPQQETKRTDSYFATDAQNVRLANDEPWVNVVIAEPGAAQQIADILFNGTEFPIKTGWLNDVRPNRVNSIVSFDTRVTEQPESQYRKLEPHLPQLFRPRSVTSLKKVDGFGPVMGVALHYAVRLAVSQAVTEHRQRYTQLPVDEKMITGRSWWVAKATSESFFRDQILPF